MTRLTTDKPNGMYELAHNSCYVGDDGAARYRDFETDIDARELARDLMQNYHLWDESDKAMHDDDVFDDEMLENLMYGTKEIQGLIALFYRNLWAMADLREHLKHYEDAEEQGLLLKLPCKIGDVVTIILSSIIPRKKIVKQAMVSEFKVYKDIYLVVKPLERPDVPYEYCIDDWGENIFPTLDAALAKMESEV